MWDLIVSVLDHCLSFYLLVKPLIYTAGFCYDIFYHSICFASVPQARLEPSE